MSETYKVRTTLRPDEEIEVGQAEFVDLSRQGLIQKAPAQAAKDAAAAGTPVPTTKEK